MNVRLTAKSGWGRQSCLQSPFRRLFGRSANPKSRLKGGCSQNWLPHIALLFSLSICQAAPWILSHGDDSVRQILPDVHQVSHSERYIFIESAGISLQSFGALETNPYGAPEGIHHFLFRI